MVEAEWKPGDALAFFPAWMETTYTGNGGKPRIHLQPDQVPAYRQHGIGRLWLFEWEQNPSKNEQHLVGLLKKLPGKQERVAFSHMKMLEVKLP